MQNVHIIDKNSKNSPQYEVSYKPHPNDEDIWTKFQKHLSSPSETMDKEQVPTITKHSRSNNLVANSSKL